MYEEDWAMDENNPGYGGGGVPSGDADYERVILESMKQQQNQNQDHHMMDEEAILQ